MTDDLWPRAKAVLDAVLEQPPSRRASELTRLCGTDEALLAEARSLLESYDPSYLEEPVAAPQPPMRSRREPMRIGDYRVIKRIGSGGMGVVYQVESASGELRALKRLARDFVTASERTRLEREGRAVAALEHPNIVRFIELFEYDGAPHIVMEYLDGRSLGKILKKKRRLKTEHAVLIAAQVAHALAAAHEAGIIHRDLKPDNILVTTDAIVKLLDFGIAKLPKTDASGSIDVSLTRTGDILGTAGYMSPEQARGERVGAAADLFALGCVLYEMLAGREAFPGDGVIARRDAVMTQEPPRVRELVPATPETPRHDGPRAPGEGPGAPHLFGAKGRGRAPGLPRVDPPRLARADHGICRQVGVGISSRMHSHTTGASQSMPTSPPIGAPGGATDV